MDSNNTAWRMLPCIKSSSSPLSDCLIRIINLLPPTVKTATEQVQTSINTVPAEDNVKVNSAEETVLAKLKAKQDWPNDYSTQEYWVNKELEDYQCMKEKPAGSLKSKAQEDWPLDFSIQKFWYNKQIEAQERMK